MTDCPAGVVRIDPRNGQKVLLVQAQQTGRQPSETDGDAVLFLAWEDIYPEDG